MGFYPGAKLVRKPGFGLSVERDAEERSEILRDLLSSEPKTNEERLFEIAFQLLTSSQAITLQFFADQKRHTNCLVPFINKEHRDGSHASEA